MLDDYTLEKKLTLIARTYADIFNGAPFFEDWNFKSALDEINYQVGNLGFKGVVEIKNQGFAWGYDLPLENSGRVDYELICSTLDMYGLDYNNSFYLSEVGVVSSIQNQGLGTILLSELSNAFSNSQNVVFRTKNPAMFAIGKKVLGELVFSKSEESNYEGGMIYGFKQY